MAINIASTRVTSQKIIKGNALSLHEVVAHLGAVQAQDYPSSKWAVALRAQCTHDDVVKEINKGLIIRTWPMRGTIHLLAAQDVRWMLKLLSAKPLAGAPKRMEFLGIDEKFITKCRTLAEKHLAGNKPMKRDEFYTMLKKNKAPMESQIGYHVVWRLSQEGVICFAGERDNQPCIALLDEWVKPSPERDREDSLRELATRYFSSHGPATLQDFIWWTALGVKDAKLALSLSADALSSINIDDTEYYFDESSVQKKAPVGTHLLAAFDEYLLGYKDRAEVLNSEHYPHVATKNGLFRPIVVHDGQTIAIWKKIIKKDRVIVEVQPFTKLTAAQKTGLKKPLALYSKYWETTVEMTEI